MEAMLTKKYIWSVFRHWGPPMVGAFALFFIGVFQLLWGPWGWIVAAGILAVASFVWSGYKAWKDCLFDPFIFELQSLIEYLETTAFQAEKEGDRAKQLVLFPLDITPPHPYTIDCDTGFRLIRFKARLQSHRERAERLLPKRCLAFLLGLLSAGPSPNLLNVQRSLAAYKQALESEKAHWL